MTGPAPNGGGDAAVSWEIREGDCLDRLREMPDASVQCVVTSPPYWGLRDYGVAGQIGLEATIDEFIGVLVNVFREVRRVLRHDGTCWVNMGDSYARSAGERNSGGGPGLEGSSQHTSASSSTPTTPRSPAGASSTTPHCSTNHRRSRHDRPRTFTQQ